MPFQSSIINHQSSIPCIVLAGGLGTRLRGVINDLPKPMAMINGKPFLHYIFVCLKKQKIKKIILSVGYRASVIESYFGDNYLDIEIAYSKEAEPLGTGGGIKKAFELVNDSAFVLNGDTFFDIDLNSLLEFHLQNEADISIALKPMKNFDRYGTVQLQENRIIHFVEKKFLAEGLINGGVYFFGKNIFENIEQEKFSFEQEVLEKLVSQKTLCGKIYNDYFIDIGIPEDYAKAQQQMK